MIWTWARRNKLTVLLLTLLFTLAILAAIGLALPELVLRWTDLLARRGISHVGRIASDYARHPQLSGPGAVATGDFWNASNAYWFAAADLTYYLSALTTLAGLLVTSAVVIYGARQLNVAVVAMRRSARQEQMRMLFDLDLALLDHPELLAATEGVTRLDATGLMRAKAGALANAFLNSCDTIFDYYEFIDRDERGTHWPVWERHLAFQLKNRPELRAIARQGIERGLYTEAFRAKLLAMVETAAHLPDAQHRMLDVQAPPASALPAAAPVLRELGADDAEALRRCYEAVYLREFPDPDERESLENMTDYLVRKKPAGWYGANGYHIVLAELAGRPVGLCVSDYAAGANAGIVEFLAVLPEERGTGIGRRLLDFTEALIVQDAARAGAGHPRGLVAEMNDPFRTDLLADNLDSFDRAMVWHRWGFRRLRMPYVQPALSPGQAPVGTLMLICKPLLPPGDSWPAAALHALLHDYLVYAMRIAEPARDASFAAMAAWLAAAGTVPLASLAAYLGRDGAADWREIRDRRDPAFAPAMSLLHRHFQDDAISLGADGFAAFLDAKQRTDLRYHYHLWVAPDPFGDDVAALASFFTLQHCGFGGYALSRKALETLERKAHKRASEAAARSAKLNGPVALAAVEERMRRDNPAITGWFIECEPGGKEHPATIFARYGFREVALDYRQPPLPGAPYGFEDAPVLRLLYKPFGESFAPPALDAATFLAAAAEIFATVYAMEQPLRSPYHQHLRQQLAGAEIPFHTLPPRKRPL